MSQWGALQHHVNAFQRGQLAFKPHIPSEWDCKWSSDLLTTRALTNKKLFLGFWFVVVKNVPSLKGLGERANYSENMNDSRRNSFTPRETGKLLLKPVRSYLMRRAVFSCAALSSDERLRMVVFSISLRGNQIQCSVSALFERAESSAESHKIKKSCAHHTICGLQTNKHCAVERTEVNSW